MTGVSLSTTAKEDLASIQPPMVPTSPPGSNPVSVLMNVLIYGHEAGTRPYYLKEARSTGADRATESAALLPL
jgi:hypothetical protein